MGLPRRRSKTTRTPWWRRRQERRDRGGVEYQRSEYRFRRLSHADPLRNTLMVAMPHEHQVRLLDLTSGAQRIAHRTAAKAAADASRLPLASRKAGAVVKAYDIDSIVGADVKTSSRYVLVAPGGKRDPGDSTTTASTVLSRKQQRHAKRRANSSASVASDAPTERDFGEIEFRDLLDQPDAIPEEGEELDLERLRIASEDSEALDAEFFGA